MSAPPIQRVPIQRIPIQRVLVTGASGFIGGHLVERLVAEGLEVRCLVRGSSRTDVLRPLGVELLTAALDDRSALREAVADVDCVFHLAARTVAPRSAEMYEVNTGGTALLAQAAAAADRPPTFVLCSSIAAAGPVARGRIRTTRDPVRPVSHYGRSKRGGELAATQLADQLPLTIVRPGIVFGPRCRDMQPMFESIQRLGLHITPGIRQPPLSWIHVDDVVEILWRAARWGRRVAPNLTASAGEAPVNRTLSRDPIANSREPSSGPSDTGELPTGVAQANGIQAGDVRSGESPAETSGATSIAAAELNGGGTIGDGCYFAVCREYPSYLDVGRMLARPLGRRGVSLVMLPEPLPWVIGAACDVVGRIRNAATPVNLDKMREALASSWACSPDEVARDLKFECPVPLAERLAETADWYQREGWL